MVALVFGLEKSRMWTLGCKNLLLLVDHKPLLGLIKNREISEVANPRLARLIERTLRWSFIIEHIKGEKNHLSDALSRFLIENYNDEKD